VLLPFAFAIATFIGMGVLLLPLLFQQTGLILGTGVLCLAALLMALLAFIVLDLIKLAKKDLPSSIEAFLTKGLQPLVRISLAVFTYGALVAYVIGAGEQLSALLGGGAQYWGTLFFVLAALLVIRKGKLSASVSMYLTLALLVVLAILIPANLLVASYPVPALTGWTSVPFLLSISIFALFGHFAMYELYHLLPRDRDRYSAFFGAFFLSFLLYVAYALSAASVGPMGPLSTVSLLFYHGPVLRVVMSLVAVLAFYTSFVSVSNSFIHPITQVAKSENHAGAALALLFFPAAFLYVLVHTYQLMTLTELVARFCGVGILLFAVLACLAHFRAARKFPAQTRTPGWLSIALAFIFSAITAFNIFPL